jgi:type II secretory pathway component PulJ
VARNGTFDETMEGMKKGSRTDKKTAALIQREQRLLYYMMLLANRLARAARRAAGTRLHSRKHEPLRFLEIYVRVHQHAVGPFLKKYF